MSGVKTYVLMVTSRRIVMPMLAPATEQGVDAGCHAYVDDYDVYGYARRIREALGVES